MENELLDAKRMDDFDFRDGFQMSVIKKASKRYDFLIDVGSGSGRFLHKMRNLFQSHLGIEITTSCLKFSTETLGLHVSSELPQNLHTPSVVTLWHSLEHLPPTIIDTILSKISKAADQDTAIVIAVPNAGSWQSHIFGRFWTYYDAPHHIHQFTYDSLTLLMKRFGFECTQSYFSWAYTWVGYILSFINFFSSRHNDLYLELKREPNGQRHSPERLIKLLMYGIVGGLAVPPSLILSIAEIFCPRKQGVINLVFRKTHENP